MVEQTIYPPPSQSYDSAVGLPPRKRNGNGIISAEAYRQVAGLFPVAQREHFVLWFKGHRGRCRRTETVLPRLVHRGQLRAVRAGRRLLYLTPSRYRGKTLEVAHGLGVTEALVRFVAARPNGLVIPERRLRPFPIVPEWGIRYPSGSLLLFEYATAVTISKTPAKIAAYQRWLHAIETHFKAAYAVVVFVLQATRAAVSQYLHTWQPAGEAFFFCDADTFFAAPDRQQLTAPIYLWGEDGASYPLAGESLSWDATFSPS